VRDITYRDPRPIAQAAVGVELFSDRGPARACASGVSGN